MPVDPTLYFLVFIGLIAACVLGVIAFQTPKRKCPACGEETPMQKRRCLYCEYRFGRA